MSDRHTIFYAEDDLDDLFIVKQAFQTFDGEITIVHANNGLEAMEGLLQLSEADTLPCLILLDINLPRYKGSEILRRLRSGTRCRDRHRP